MTTDIRIRDEKLQDDIIRKAALMSVLSSRKINKYKFLTSKEILPPDQRRVIEKATFTYSPLGKTFEKQIKNIEDQTEKQIKALEQHGKQLLKCNNEKESSKHLKQQERFEELANKRMEEIQDLSKQIDFNNLTYSYKGNIASKNFIRFKGPLGFYRNI